MKITLETLNGGDKSPARIAEILREVAAQIENGDAARYQSFNGAAPLDFRSIATVEINPYG